MTPERRDRLLGWLCAGGLLVVWVSFHLMARLTSRQSLTSWDVAALRYGGRGDGSAGEDGGEGGGRGGSGGGERPLFSQAAWDAERLPSFFASLLARGS